MKSYVYRRPADYPRVRQMRVVMYPVAATVEPSALWTLPAVSRTWELDHASRTWDLPEVDRTWTAPEIRA